MFEKKMASNKQTKTLMSVLFHVDLFVVNQHQRFVILLLYHPDVRN